MPQHPRLLQGCVTAAVAAVAAGLLSGPPAAAVAPPSRPAGVTASPAAPAKKPPFAASASARELTWTIRRTRQLPRMAKIRQVKPCLRLQYRNRSADVCLVSRKAVRVRHSGYRSDYRLGIQLEKNRNSFGVRISAADLMLRSGRPRVVATCLADGCGDRWDPAPTPGRVVVPRRVLQYCAGASGRVTAAPAATKAVALTFDDGPGGQTRAVLRVLRQMGVPATFFQVGSMTGGQQALMQRMRRQGHVLANHTFNHADLSRLSDAAAGEEIAAANRAIRNATGFQPCLFRAPYGAEDERVIGVAGRLGLLTVGWSVDPADWRRPGAAAISARVMADVGDGSVILLHDGGGSDGGTPAAVRTFVQKLRDRGYRFLTVPELFDLPVQYG